MNETFILQNDIEISTTDETQRTDLLNEFETTVNNSELAHGMQELLGTYLALERYFLEESANKALGMDTLDPDQQTSSMVDDVFFIVQKCVRYVSHRIPHLLRLFFFWSSLVSPLLNVEATQPVFHDKALPLA